jgi:hypothetical protein
MRDLMYVVRYFRVVPPVPRLMAAAFVALTVACGCVTVLIDNGDAAALVPIVVLQAFSVTTGFVAFARRGYFDLLIARGHPRTHIAIVQWLLAVAPGLCSWLSLAAVHALFHDGENPLLRSGTVVTIFMVSTIPWAVNVDLPRFSGAIGWLLLVALASTGGVIWPDSLHVVVFPIAVVGSSLGNRLDVLAAALALSVVSMGIALWWIRRTDIRLEAAQ